MTDWAMEDHWKQLAEELALWQQQGVTATLWWRDDDAQRATTELKQLNELSRRYRVPLALAVIPLGADTSLLPLFEQNAQLYALQHGFSHHNHAPAEQRKCELGNHRPLQTVCADLSQGRKQLQALLAERFIEVLVPPWNRLSDQLLGLLPELGFNGLSALGPRASKTEHGLWLNHVHIDLINWRDGKRFAGEPEVLAQLMGHLRQRRLGLVDRDEATGLMSHHLAHDPQCWRFCQRLFEFLQHQPVRWLSAAECFERLKRGGSVDLQGGAETGC